MFLSGDNRYSQLSDKTESKLLFPPFKSHLNVSSLLSYSVAHNFSVWVDKNNDAHSSRNAQIDIRDKDGQKYKFLSAVCGEYYTLYLAYNQNKNDNYQLIYEKSNKNYIFLNIGNRNPKAIFGGYNRSASIDSEGAILITSPVETLIEPVFLPDNDKAVNIACCDSFYVALGKSGKVYIYIISESTKPAFSQIHELKDEKIIDISGTTEHCFFVTNKGKVFGCGSNVFKRLGIIECSSRFCPINTLNKYNIVAAFAGFDHSLFITSDGESLSCGYNDYAQTLLFQEPKREKVCPPVIVPYKGKAKFFVLGYGITVGFIDCQVPPNMPNKGISNEQKIDSRDIELEQSKKEIQKLLQTQEELRQKIKELEKKQKSQQKEIEKYQKKSSKAQKGLDLITVSDLQELETVKKIGRGATAEVFEVIKQQQYAMKVFEPQYCKSEDNDDDQDESDSEIDFKKMKRFMKEYEILNQLDHPNILKAHGFCLGDRIHPPTILLEYCPSNLKKKIKKLTNDERISIIFEISSAMKQIHSLGIVHCNLKLENILLDANNHVKVSDFGHAILLNPSESLTLTQLTGTLKYMAPELINGTDYNEKVDVYSFGVILYLILSKGEFPKIGFVEIGNGKKAEIPSSFSSFSKNLINKCWSFKPEDRPSFSEIYENLEENKDKLI